ncbi:hypothetical protein GIV19_09975 [Pseudomonas syringae]|uniref:hypothetical protein n=1 Tax=Pseudomonas syringae TaxID=317 RepID=UPI001F3C10DE|nr:hypothetical protein [Pseudomonas syringae]MCF5707620.1 hypothetical protein [Pseudomonas syringae]
MSRHSSGSPNLGPAVHSQILNVWINRQDDDHEAQILETVLRGCCRLPDLGWKCLGRSLRSETAPASAQAPVIQSHTRYETTGMPQDNIDCEQTGGKFSYP